MPINLDDVSQPVKCQVRYLDKPAIPFVSMTRAAAIVPGTPLGERLLQAVLAEGHAVANLEAELGFSAGHLGRIIRGQRWVETVDVEAAKRIAAKLHVNFAWLVIGEGPMRRDGRPSTEAEEAMAYARRFGTREDAIQLAWEKNKHREKEMERWDWMKEFIAAAEHLNGPNPSKTGYVVKRPEVVGAEKRSIKTASKKKRHRREKPAVAETPAITSPASSKLGVG